MDQSPLLFLSGNQGCRWKGADLCVPKRAPIGMQRHGIRKEDFKIGDVVRIAGSPARDQKKHLGWVRNIKYSDGRIVRLPKNGIP